MLCGSAFKNKGVQPLLDAVVDLLPSPMDIPPVQGWTPDRSAVQTRKAEDKEPFSALVFKIMTDPFVGQLAFFRVYSGSLNTGSYVYNSTKQARERLLDHVLGVGDTPEHAVGNVQHVLPVVPPRLGKALVLRWRRLHHAISCLEATSSRRSSSPERDMSRIGARPRR